MKQLSKNNVKNKIKNKNKKNKLLILKINFNKSTTKIILTLILNFKNKFYII